MNRLFIAGTDTNVGKTVCSAAILKMFPLATYWKPVQTGDDDDTLAVRKLSGLSIDRFLEPAYRFPLPRSPHLAARSAGAEIELSTIVNNVPGRCPLIEGAGGLLVPLNHDTLQIDLVATLKLPVLLVAADKLGAINHTLLSLEACRRRGIEVAGVVLNRGTEDFGNRESILEFGDVSCVLTNPESSSPKNAMDALVVLLRELF